MKINHRKIRLDRDDEIQLPYGSIILDIDNISYPYYSDQFNIELISLEPEREEGELIIETKIREIGEELKEYSSSYSFKKYGDFFIFYKTRSSRINNINSHNSNTNDPEEYSMTNKPI